VYSHAYAYAMQRDWNGVERTLALRRPTGNPVGELEVGRQAAVFAVDRGQWDEALRLARDALAASEKTEPVFNAPLDRLHLLGIELLADARSQAQLTASLDAAIRDIRGRMAGKDEIDRIDLASQLQALGYLAARNGARDALGSAIAGVDTVKELAGYPLLVQMQTVLHAELDRLHGRPAEAVRRLAPLVAKDEAI